MSVLFTAITPGSTMLSNCGLQSDTKSESLYVYSQSTLIIWNTNLIVKPPGNSSSNNTSNSTSASLLAVKEEERGQTGNQTTRSWQ